MRVLNALILSLLLPLPVLAAQKPAFKGAFAKYHKKSQSSNPLKLDDASYEELIAIPRNHSTVIILTAMSPEMRCGLCREVQPEYQLLAKSWARGDKEGASQVLFGTLDFATGRKTFESLMLQTAPILMLFPATTGPHAAADPKPVQMDFAMGPQPAEALHKWVSRHLPASVYKPPIRRPFNYVNFAITSTVLLGLVTVIAVAWPYVGPLLQNRNIWAAGCLIAILLFISGHMYNQIRGTPYVAGDGKGGINYFAGGFQNQFGLESQIIAAIYAVLSLAMLALTLRVPRMKSPAGQRVAVFVWGGVMLVGYSALLKVFKVKNGQYPFWLPPF